MEYQDLEIDVRSTAEGSFEATVTAAPFGDRPRVNFPRPVDMETLGGIRRWVEAQVRSAAGRQADGDEAPPGEGPAVSPPEIGARLHRALFQEDLGELLVRCRAALVAEGAPRLRLRLKFHLGDPEASYLAALPWEWLYDSESATFLATDRATPVLRRPWHLLWGTSCGGGAGGAFPLLGGGRQPPRLAS